MNLKRAWDELWKPRRKHTRDVTGVRIPVNMTSIHYVELYGDHPHIFFDKDCRRWICMNIVTLHELNRGSIGAISRKTGFGDTPEDAYKDWDKPFERIVE